MGKPHLAVASLGGTITMTTGAKPSGVTPALTAAELLDTVPSLAEIADVQAGTLAKEPGASLGFTDVLDALDWAGAAVAGGAAGVVLVQGTDTIEETTYLMDLHWNRPEPLVVTGAMRPPQQPGADGPANLLAAAITAVDPASRGLGALVVLNDQVHAAARVRKRDTTAVDAFGSTPFGPLARIHEGRVTYVNRPRPWPAVRPPERDRLPRVALLETFLGDDGELLRLVVEAGHDGVVICGFGAGHVSAKMADAVEAAAGRMPVVLASRTGAGTVLNGTYGFPGSERDLLRRGVIPSGWLDGRKARVLLWSLLATRESRERIRAVFGARGGGLGGPGDR